MFDRVVYNDYIFADNQKLNASNNQEEVDMKKMFILCLY